MSAQLRAMVARQRTLQWFVITTGALGLAACSEEVGDDASTGAGGVGAGTGAGAGGSGGEVDLGDEGDPLDVDVPATGATFVALQPPAVIPRLPRSPPGG